MIRDDPSNDKNIKLNQFWCIPDGYLPVPAMVDLGVLDRSVLKQHKNRETSKSQLVKFLTQDRKPVWSTAASPEVPNHILLKA